MPRGSNVFRSVAIEVVAFPPVSTSKWKKDNLDNNIKKIREIFLKELGQDKSNGKEGKKTTRVKMNGQKAKTKT